MLDSPKEGNATATTQPQSRTSWVRLYKNYLIMSPTQIISRNIILQKGEVGLFFWGQREGALFSSFFNSFHWSHTHMFSIPLPDYCFNVLDTLRIGIWLPYTFSLKVAQQFWIKQGFLLQCGSLCLLQLSMCISRETNLPLLL